MQALLVKRGPDITDLSSHVVSSFLLKVNLSASFEIGVAINVYGQFYLSIFVFLQHRSSLNEFLTRFLQYISNRTEQYSAERYLSFH